VGVDRLSPEEKIKLALAFLYYGGKFYGERWIQLTIVSGQLKYGFTQNVKRIEDEIYRSQKKYVEIKVDKIDTFYRLTPEGIQYIDSWSEEDKEKYKKILKDINWVFPP
jgi:hypothetical protein